MGPTPLYDALKKFAGEDPLRMHMPGHKGKAMPAPEFSPLAAIDFTELGPTGDLFSGDGPIREAEALWAQALGMSGCLFLTGGSTQGMLSALTLACRPGDTLLLDRGSHRSAYNALALLDLTPVYLNRPWLEGAGVTGPVSPHTVEELLKTHPEIKTVCITSPTYYGVLSDIPTLAAVVHAHGGTLVVDAAHGAHLPFLGNDDLSAADLAVVSAHKTLPALGQAALLLAGRGETAAELCSRPTGAGGGHRFSHAALRRAASLFGSSSPSYVLMASLDLARAWMEEEGRAACEKTALAVAALRGRFPFLTALDAPLDPCRLVLRSADGFALQSALEEQGVYVEMADRGHVVCILTAADSGADLARLEDALAQTLGSHLTPEAQARACAAAAVPPPPPLPEAALSPRAARFAPSQRVPLRRAEGRTAACQIAPYPPGVPVIAPGEHVGKKHLAYLREIGYNMEEVIEVVRPAACVAETDGPFQASGRAAEELSAQKDAGSKEGFS